MVQAAPHKDVRPKAPAVGMSQSRSVEAGLARNREVASRFDEYADLLDQQDASPFRVRAYRRAARVIDGLNRPIGEILDARGQDGLMDLPGVGAAIARAIVDIVRTGRWMPLERLRGAATPDALFRTLPGVGPRLARQLADDLHLETLEQLEIATANGDLDRAPGWGPKRVAMVRAVLAERLGRRRLQGRAGAAARPGEDLLLEIDREYREKAAAGTLKTITPRRFNPTGEAWLPVLHAERGDWSFTALYSNTARAHQLGRTHDWVVIHYQTDSQPEGQCTVVTERTGPLAGRRVVRGDGPGGAHPP